MRTGWRTGSPKPRTFIPEDLHRRLRVCAMERRQGLEDLRVPQHRQHLQTLPLHQHLTGQRHEKTSIVYEYPQPEGDPYYPIPRPQNAELNSKYQALVHENERSGAAWTLEWLVLPQMLIATAASLRVSAKLVHQIGW